MSEHPCDGRQRDDLPRPANGPDRRRLLLAAAAGAAAMALPCSGALAIPSAAFAASRSALANGREIGQGRVLLDVPRLAESGNSVPLKVTVESPMTPADHVTAIHLLSEQNPVAMIATFRLSRRAGRAQVETNIRLATTQNVHAISEMSDGSLWGASSEVVVLLAACLDPS